MMRFPLLLAKTADSSMILDAGLPLGIVEAGNAQRELFGFERTCDISGKSAQVIADAAKAWGQNDDITVLTVRRSK